jgi:hypothetical protein
MMVTKLDRLARSTGDLLDIIHAIGEADPGRFARGTKTSPQNSRACERSEVEI